MFVKGFDCLSVHCLNFIKVPISFFHRNWITIVFARKWLSSKRSAAVYIGKQNFGFTKPVLDINIADGSTVQLDDDPNTSVDSYSFTTEYVE